jgi:hypothetical protein
MTEVTDKVRLEKIKKENERIIMRVFGVGYEKFCNVVLSAVLSIDLYFFHCVFLLLVVLIGYYYKLYEMLKL